MDDDAFHVLVIALQAPFPLALRLILHIPLSLPPGLILGLSLLYHMRVFGLFQMREHLEELLLFNMLVVY